MPELVSDAYRNLWRGLEPRLEAGIRTFRMAQAEVRVVDAAGTPVPGAVVEAEQTGHAFHFGANSFLLDAYDDAGLNQRYEECFLRLFNAATVAMYWRELEPVQGAPRFAADSERRWRRPPTDPVVEWGRRHNLLLNGHCLVWDNPKHAIPDWMPSDPAEAARLTAKRIRELGERYGTTVQRWDVLNERMHSWRRAPRHPEVCMPLDFDILAFREAQAVLPAWSTLMINDYLGVFNPAPNPYHDLVREMDGRGARIDTIGLQMHNFDPAANMQICREATRFRGDHMLQGLDAYTPLGRPLHISEITIAQPEESPAGEAAQAEMVRDYYRLWFSHPLVDSITWWNFADGGAVKGEDGVLSGLIDRQHRPKAAFRALDKLINEEWTTRTGALTAGAEGCVRFRGFKGPYRLTASAGGRRATVTAALTAPATLTITL